MTKIQNTKHVRGFENCNLKLVLIWNLALGIWDFLKLCDYFERKFINKVLTLQKSRVPQV